MNNPSLYIHHHESKYTKCSILVPTTKSKYPASQTWIKSPPIMPLPLNIHRSHPKKLTQHVALKDHKILYQLKCQAQKPNPKVITCIHSCQISIAEITPTTSVKPIQLSIPQRYNKWILHHQHIQSVTCNHKPQEQYLLCVWIVDH